MGGMPASKTIPKDSGDGGDDGGHRKKRSRVLYSCTECHRRKQKCNRQTPCHHCITRNAPHLCQQYRPGYDSLDTDSRISRLEMVVDDGIEQILKRLQSLEEVQRSLQGGPVENNGNQLKQQRAADTSFHHTNNTSSSSSSLTEPKGFDPLTMTLPYDSASASYAFLRTHLYPGAEGELAKESKLTRPVLHLLEKLSNQQRCLALIQLFFEKANLIYMPLSTSELQPKLQLFVTDGPTLRTDDLHCFSILASILCIATLCAPDELCLNGPTSRIPEARSLLHAAHLALLTADPLQSDDLDKVIAWILLSRALVIDDRSVDAWQAATRAVSTAYAINLHKESRMAIVRKEEEMERRRIWSMVYYQERNLSVVLNRPSTIQDQLCTTLPPTDIDRRDDDDDAANAILSQFVYFHTLAQLMGRVNVIVQSTDGNSYFKEALQLDASICQFRNEMLPPFFSQTNLQDVDAKDIPAFFENTIKDMIISHQWIIASEIDALRISLHRPFLSPSSIGSQQSRAASIEVSCQSLTRRASLVKVIRGHFGGASEMIPRWYTVLHKQSNRFNMVLACCVSLLLNPRDGDALKLRRLIQEYMDVLPRRTQRSLEAADYRRVKSLERELKVLQLFLDRANSLSALPPPLPASSFSSSSSSSTMVTSMLPPLPIVKTIVEQANDALNSTYWQIDDSPTMEGQAAAMQDEIYQPTASDGASVFFDYLTQGNTDEMELQTSLLDVIGSIPWSFEST